LEEINLRKTSLLILLLLTIFLMGCSKVTSSNDLIYDADRIDVVSIGKVTGVGTSEGSNLNDKEKVKEIVNFLKDIEVEELSAEEERKIYKNAEVWSKKVRYDFSLVASTEENNTDPGAALKGAVTVLTDGYLLFLDPKTMGPFEDGKIERTISYISTERQEDTIKRILEIVNEN